VAVNNAAITPTTPVMQITPEEFDKVLAINLRGTFLGCQVFGAAMARPATAASSTSPRWPGRTAARRPAPITPRRRAAS
jgi:NAD(P)-dependent dehydrogenase (short-subunit alcohol dehydrogenase family)